MQKKKVAGMSIGGGRKENFFFCLLEYFPETNRWFLSSVHQVKEEELDGDDAIHAWINHYELEELMLDFPLSSPACDRCKLSCPGLKNCPDQSVAFVRSKMQELLEHDNKLFVDNPKKYEQERNKLEEVDFLRNEFAKESFVPMMSKAFKRKLKKGFLPYWHRSLDLWIWKHYYDPLLNIFKSSYDSFGNVSTMLLARFKYLKRHFPQKLNLYESSVQLCLLELYRGKVITKSQLQQLSLLEESVFVRHAMVKLIEQKLNVFMYDRDLEMISLNPRAFDSFILALAGKQLLDKKIREIPLWAQEGGTSFVLPYF